MFSCHGSVQELYNARKDYNYILIKSLINRHFSPFTTKKIIVVAQFFQTEKPVTLENGFLAILL